MGLLKFLFLFLVHGYGLWSTLTVAILLFPIGVLLQVGFDILSGVHRGLSPAAALEYAAISDVPYTHRTPAQRERYLELVR